MEFGRRVAPELIRGETPTSGKLSRRKDVRPTAAPATPSAYPARKPIVRPRRAMRFASTSAPSAVPEVLAAPGMPAKLDEVKS
jgi:hypothetical protein